MSIQIVHHPDYTLGPPGGKNALVRDLLLAEGDRIAWHTPEPMQREWLEAVHDPAYVEEVLSARVPRDKERRIGFPVTPDVARRAQAVPGGTYLASLLALEHGYAANSAGGSHHALADTGAGYCVFNDLAVAAVRLIEERRVARVAIVDCDVHQGDGTAVLTAARPEIATYSIHAEKNFPARKARSTLDVPLADGTGDEAYLAALAETLPSILDAHRPELVLYQAGIDPFEGDRLGRLALSEAGLISREWLVAGLMKERRIPFLSTTGGGYAADAGQVALRHVRTIFALSMQERNLRQSVSACGEL